MTRSMEVVYGDLWSVRDLDSSPVLTELAAPRGPHYLIEMVAQAGLEMGATILDVGCGEGHYACKLAEQFQAQVIATDPVESNLTLAHQVVAEKGLASQVTVQYGLMEKMTFADAQFDLVWCRGVLIHVADAEKALRECYRVLKPGGMMMVMLCSGTELLTPTEAEQLCDRMGFVYENFMGRAHLETLMQTVGFTLNQTEYLTSEMAEYYEAMDGRGAKDLLRVAKLQRAEAEFVARYGRDKYETALSRCHWQLYQLLGKVGYEGYILHKSK